MKEIRSLTSLRGVAAVWVAIVHLSWVLVPEKLVEVFPLFRMSYLAVDFFFILSGFVLVYSYNPLKETFKPGVFLIRRFFRIYPAHIVILLVFGLFILILGSGNFDQVKFSGTGFALSTGLIQSFTETYFFAWNYPAWTLTYELWIFPLVILLLYTVRKYISFLYHFPYIPIVILILYIFIQQDAGFLINVLTPSQAFMRCIPEVLTGALLGFAFHSGKLKKPWSILVTGLFIFSIVSTYVFPLWVSISLWLAFFSVLIPYLVYNDIPILSRFGLHKIGLWSYSIYLIHAPMERYIATLGIEKGNYILVYFLYILAFIAVGALSYYIIERPFIVLGKKISERK